MSKHQREHCDAFREHVLDYQFSCMSTEKRSVVCYFACLKGGTVLRLHEMLRYRAVRMFSKQGSMLNTSKSSSSQLVRSFSAEIQIIVDTKAGLKIKFIGSKRT